MLAQLQKVLPAFSADDCSAVECFGGPALDCTACQASSILGLPGRVTGDELPFPRALKKARRWLGHVLCASRCPLIAYWNPKSAAVTGPDEKGDHGFRQPQKSWSSSQPPRKV